MLEPVKQSIWNSFQLPSRHVHMSAHIRCGDAQVLPVARASRVGQQLLAVLAFITVHDTFDARLVCLIAALKNSAIVWASDQVSILANHELLAADLSVRSADLSVNWQSMFHALNTCRHQFDSHCNQVTGPF